MNRYPWILAAVAVLAVWLTAAWMQLAAHR
jgi:hypothetical protein